MYNQSVPSAHFTSRHFGLLALVLAAALLGTLAISIWWAVQRIDSMALAEESRALTAAISQERNQMVGDQKASTVWDDAVVNLRTNNQGWMAENLVDWMSKFYSYDRVYVVAAGGGVVRAASQGRFSGKQIDPRDRLAVEPLLQDARQSMAEVSAGLPDSTHAIADIGIVDLIRFPDGALGFISVRPIVGTTNAASQRPGTEFLHVAIKVLQTELLTELSERFGLADLKVAGPSNTRASIALRNAQGRQIAYLTWAPDRPALHVLLETAPAALGIFFLGVASMFGLLAWLRRAATQLETSRAQTSFLAFHDPLTGLANRVLFRTSLEEAMGYEYLAAAKVLLISIDLDHFKEVNDTLGHAAGDQLLGQVAKRFSQALSEGATLARLAGDEFAIVQPGIVSDGHARWLCQSILQTLNQPFVLSSGPIHVTASLGVALEPGDAMTAQEMLRRADVALYAAKAAGRNCVEIYTAEMDRARREKRTLEVDLRQALISGIGLYLVYQPVFDAVSGEIAGAEALIRWLHPTRGNLSPDDFIGIAEETGVIEALGLWVLDEASKFAATSGLPRIAVNVSPLQFLDPQFPDHVIQILRRRDLEASRLELEITEGLLLKNSQQVHQSLVRLRGAGLHIALDDFGTGYSSISYLRTYNVDKLKIDQSFTRLMDHDQPTHTIVRSVIEMAHALGMCVTAEGVEEESQRHILQDLGCDYLQGYLLSRPLTGERLTELLAKRPPETRSLPSKSA